jgi:hypothetical protein
MTNWENLKTYTVTLKINGRNEVFWIEATNALEAIQIAEAEEGNPPREAAATVRKAMYKEWNCDNHDVFTGACLNTKAGV